MHLPASNRPAARWPLCPVELRWVVELVAEPTMALARMEPLASLDPRSPPARAKVLEERSRFVSCGRPSLGGDPRMCWPDRNSDGKGSPKTRLSSAVSLSTLSTGDADSPHPAIARVSTSSKRIRRAVLMAFPPERSAPSRDAMYSGRRQCQQSLPVVRACQRLRLGENKAEQHQRRTSSMSKRVSPLTSISLQLKPGGQTPEKDGSPAGSR
jgi:hypothetical protein